jgi:hypothetical protein
LASPEEALTVADIAKLSKTLKATVQKELKLLEGIGFLHKSKVRQAIKPKSKTKKAKLTTKFVTAYSLNQDFEYLAAMRSLLTQVSSEQGSDLSKRVRRAGRIKALIVSGVFLQDNSSRVDILIVGDTIKHRALESAIRATEAELGQALRYTVFTTNEFKYRMDMRDKLICDILDTPHKKLLNRLNL